MTSHIHLLIQGARAHAGISQAELARRAGVPRSVMNVYEHGKRQPSAEMLARVLGASGFRITIEPFDAPVDVERAGRILEQVIGLAEALPYSPKAQNQYPPLSRTLLSRELSQAA